MLSAWLPARGHVRGVLGTRPTEKESHAACQVSCQHRARLTLALPTPQNFLRMAFVARATNAVALSARSVARKPSRLAASARAVPARAARLSVSASLAWHHAGEDDAHVDEMMIQQVRRGEKQCRQAAK